MRRRVAPLLIVLLAALLSGCSKSPSEGGAQPVTFLASGRIGALKITGAAMAPSLSVSSADIAEKLDASLRPANPADTRNVALELTVVSETLKEMLPLSCDDFVLTYSGGSARCVGLSFGDQWILATAGSPEIKLIYNQPGETRQQKLLFLIPKSATTAMLELKSKDQPTVQLARISLP